MVADTLLAVLAVAAVDYSMPDKASVKVGDTLAVVAVAAAAEAAAVGSSSGKDQAQVRSAGCCTQEDRLH